MKFNLFPVTITGKEKWSGPPLSSILFLPLLQIPPKKEKGKVGKGKDFFVPAEEGEKKLKVPGEVAHLSQKLCDRRKGRKSILTFLPCTFFWAAGVNSGFSSVPYNGKKWESYVCLHERVAVVLSFTFRAIWHLEQFLPYPDFFLFFREVKGVAALVNDILNC